MRFGGPGLSRGEEKDISARKAVRSFSGVVAPAGCLERYNGDFAFLHYFLWPASAKTSFSERSQYCAKRWSISEGGRRRTPHLHDRGERCAQRAPGQRRQLRAARRGRGQRRSDGESEQHATPRRHRRDDQHRHKNKTMADGEPMEEAPADAPAEGEVESRRCPCSTRCGRAQARPDPAARGLSEVAKALDSARRACCLAKTATTPNTIWSSLLRRGRRRWSWSTRAALGEWAILEINEEGEATRWCAAACALVRRGHARFVRAATYLKAQAPET